MMMEFRLAFKKREELQNKITKIKERVSKLEHKVGCVIGEEFICLSKTKKLINGTLNELIQEKTGHNLVNLQKHKTQLEAMENELRDHNELLKKELPSFLDTRIDLIQPTLESYTKSKVLFWGETLSALTSFSFLSEMESTRVQNWPDYQTKQKDLMKQLSQLSIVEGNE
jgi:hypothetical protein